jgi:DNA-binding transcriptional MocR family regulator
VTSGAQQALSLLAQLLVRPGDVVGVEEYTYPGALDVFLAAGARLRAVGLTADGADIGQLEDLIERAAPRLIYLVPTFQNPTGTVLPASARRRLLRAAEARRVLVIDDQVLAELAFDESAAIPSPLACYGNASSVLSVGSLSKLVWGGLRIGWIRADGQMAADLARAKAISDLGSDVLSQMVAVELFARLDEVIPARRLELRQRRDQLSQRLAGALPESEFELPLGGQTLWLRLPGCDTRRFAQVALRHGVAVLEESSLAAEGGRHEHLRIPLTLSADVLTEATVRLADAWRAYQRSSAGSHP